MNQGCKREETIMHELKSDAQALAALSMRPSAIYIRIRNLKYHSISRCMAVLQERKTH